MTMTSTQPAAVRTNPPNPAAIQITDLVVSYGEKRVVNSLTLTVPTGSIYGFLGPNGSGKTTTIKTLMGFRQATSGSGSILGLDIAHQSTELRSKVGYVTELGGLYDDLSVEQMGGFFRSTAQRWQQSSFERHLDEFKLPRQVRVRSLSKGMKMQLAFSLAMGGEPELLILDEPTSGLDPVARHELLNTLVTEVAAAGRTVFFSSHNLAEVEAVADSVGIIRAGHLVLAGKLDEIKQHHKVLKITYDIAPTPADLTTLRTLSGVTRLEDDGRTLRLSVAGEVQSVIQAVRSKGGVRDLEVIDQNLEDLFLELMKEEPS